MSFKVISLFTGCGGFDLGFGGDVCVHKKSVTDETPLLRSATVKDFVNLKRLPFETVFMNDVLPKARDVYLQNFQTDPEKYLLEDIVKLLETDFVFPDAEVVIGGFPCQDFSHCGKREGSHSERGSLYKSFVEVVKRVRPKVFVAENVYGLLTTKGAIETIIDDFSSLGYSVNYQLVDCSKFGVPQKRKRVIIIGTTDVCEWNLSNPAVATVGDYLRHVDEPGDDCNDISQNTYSKTKRQRPQLQGQKCVCDDGFAPTIRSSHNGNIEFRRHGEDERRLTVRECGLLQTFPPDFIFHDEKRTQTSYKLIGNAVPPLLSYVIAQTVLKLLLR